MKFFPWAVWEPLFLQFTHRLITSLNTAYLDNHLVEIKGQYLHKIILFVPNWLSNLTTWNDLAVPSPQKSALLKREWDTQRLLGESCAIFSFYNRESPLYSMIGCHRLPNDLTLPHPNRFCTADCANVAIFYQYRPYSTGIAIGSVKNGKEHKVLF